MQAHSLNLDFTVRIPFPLLSTAGAGKISLKITASPLKLKV